jgi:hypothetical protein
VTWKQQEELAVPFGVVTHQRPQKPSGAPLGTVTVSCPALTTVKLAA